MKCENCERITVCSVCRLCLNCYCRCWRCITCKTKYPNTKHSCRNCASCRKCCVCRKAPKYITDANLGIIGTRSLISQLPRTLGMELEIGEWGTLLPTARTSIPGIFFNTSHDWSVKPSETEMVLQPLRGDALIKGMLNLSRTCLEKKCKINNSCALHVHVGGKDLSYWDIRRLLEVYTRIEGQIYDNLISPHRKQIPSIHYCQMMTRPHTSENCDRCHRYDEQYPGQRQLPEEIESVLTRMRLAKSTKDLKICLLRMLYGIENPSHIPTVVQTKKGGHWEFCRYFGLNLHSWQHRLTVEFRMKEATFDPMEMIMWPLWCGWLVHAVTRMSDADSRSAQMSVRYVTEKYMPKYFGMWLEKHRV